MRIVSLRYLVVRIWREGVGSVRMSRTQARVVEDLTSLGISRSSNTETTDMTKEYEDKSPLDEG
jgi:hypothetical protein